MNFVFRWLLLKTPTTISRIIINCVNTRYIKILYRQMNRKNKSKDQMRRLAYLALILISNSLFSQMMYETPQEIENRTFDTVFYINKYMVITNSIEEAVYYEKCSLLYRNGAKHGKCIRYYMSGEVRSKGYFNNGYLKGKFKIFFKNGGLSAVLKFSRKGRKYHSIYDLDGSKILSKGTGKYKYYNHNDVLIFDGWIKKNVEDSLWTAYDHRGKIKEDGYNKFKNEKYYWLAKGVYDSLGNNLLSEDRSGYVINKGFPVVRDNVWSSEGAYENGLKTGIWTFYNREGEIIFQRDWNFYEYKDYPPGFNTPIYQEKETRPPSFKGGYAMMKKYISENFHFPEELKEYGVTKQIVASFHVSESGSIDGAQIINSLHPLIDVKILELITKFPDWNPAMKNGEAVKQKVILPINISYF